MEIITQPLYDILSVHKGVERLDFFHVPLGVRGKTMEDTNMYFAHSLPEPQRFIVESLRVRALFHVPAFYNAGQLELMIGSKVYLYGAPLREFKAWKGFPVAPLMLEPLQNFGVSLIWRNGFPFRAAEDGTDRIAVHLYGRLARPLH
jgi:hypothetical protein